jgi:hypothetical protein
MKKYFKKHPYTKVTKEIVAMILMLLAVCGTYILYSSVVEVNESYSVDTVSSAQWVFISLLVLMAIIELMSIVVIVVDFVKAIKYVRWYNSDKCGYVYI